MKFLFSVFFFAAASCSSCSKSGEGEDFCKAIHSRFSTQNVEVHGLKIYGNIYHPSIAISTKCMKPAFNFWSFDAPSPTEQERSMRIKKFNMAVYASVSKKSGMFEFDGLVRVNPNKNLVTLTDVKSFRELDKAEADRILTELRSSRDE
ncbi:hypothetical protein NG829_20480 [Xanthomonas sacchari]|uniref:Lipoprotein n=1 Tax=Xanthomonas sacchari TaxID=56458 RepID=A0AA46SUK1_9XANT|nr:MULTISPECIES: hypothetical protein [Xanthomonas]MDY4341374.1 hypothetical protein [Xanthomonas sp. LF07-6]UYK80676.1 hypothetical protein NG829_20480 [Xanthomonas sacchari]UYK88809.1 hypothetical protein NG824_20490 [Xanthomonas sacchari]